MEVAGGTIRAGWHNRHAFERSRTQRYGLKPNPTPSRIKPAVHWPGGKSRLLKYLLPYIPAHTCYCEPFGGGLAVFLAKPRSHHEIINDANGDLVNFYRCVRFHRDPLLAELEFTLNSREEFKDFNSQVGLTDIQRAARWYYRNRLCFGGSYLTAFAVGAVQAIGSSAARMEAIRALEARLDRVTIEHQDWKRCLDLYDRTGTFFFLDPPYTDCDAGMYSSWTQDDVKTLRDRLARLKGRWLLTLNDSSANRATFEHCLVESVSRQRGINNKPGSKGDRVYRELIIRPADPVAALAA